MGQPIDRIEFTDRDFRKFSARLNENLDVLRALLARPDFGSGECCLGAELELYIVDDDARPFPSNQELKSAFGDDRLTLELNRYNLEFNFSPIPLSGSPFTELENACTRVLKKLNSMGKSHENYVLPIGILPTLSLADLGPGIMTDEPRYRALTRMLREMRGGPFDICIGGRDPLNLKSDDVSVEGVCTSFQIHYKFPPERFVRVWNALQMVTPVVLALAANSPLLLGHRLWHETRIPVFKQAIDGRRAEEQDWRQPPRVNFGNGWLRRSAYELFAEMVHLYTPLIPLCDEEEPDAALAGGKIPRLRELCLHNGTIWSWTRPIYGAEDGGHLRIELRSLPAGPTAIDMAANAAFYLGLGEGLGEEIDELLTSLPFHYAERNFYRAAKFGLDATLVWPQPGQTGLQEMPVTDIAEQLLPIAARGLGKIGIDRAESKRLLGVIEQRLLKRQTGAIWQLAQFNGYTGGAHKQEGLKLLVERYRHNVAANRPVSEWEMTL